MTLIRSTFSDDANPLRANSVVVNQGLRRCDDDSFLRRRRNSGPGFRRDRGTGTEVGATPTRVTRATTPYDTIAHLCLCAKQKDLVPYRMVRTIPYHSTIILWLAPHHTTRFQYHTPFYNDIRLQLIFSDLLAPF